MKPRLLDLFCGAGGAAMGYHRAGFDVFGIDKAVQRNYPFLWVRSDAVPVLASMDLDRFDAIHASPPCQAYSHAQYLGNRGRKDNPRLIGVVREYLEASGLPYVIENVNDARPELRDPYLLCGSMFGLEVRRHRLFETNFPMLVPACQHGVEGERRFPGTPRIDGTRPDSRVVNQMASGTTHQMLADAMGIDWIGAPGRKRPTRDLCEAIPPAYTEFIGEQLMAHLNTEARAA